MGHCIFYSKIESIYLSIYTYGYIEREGEGMLPGTGERWWYPELSVGGAMVVAEALSAFLGLSLSLLDQNNWG